MPAGGSLFLDEPAAPGREPAAGRAPAGSRPRRARGRRGFGPGQVVLLGVTAALAVVWLTPLVWTVITSVKPEAETTKLPLTWWPTVFTADAYRKVSASGDIWLWMANSLFTAAMTTLLVVAFSSMAAYGFARLEFPGRRVLLAITVTGIMVPPQVLLVPLFDEMAALGLVDTVWGILLPQAVAPAMVYVLVKFFRGIPREVEEAAIVDGASRWLVFWRVVLPLSRPVLAAVAIFTFVTTWNNFLWPFIVTSDPGTMTLPVGLATVQSSYGVRYAQIMASTTLASLPLLVLFLVFQRQIVRGIAHTGLAGQ